MLATCRYEYSYTSQFLGSIACTYVRAHTYMQTLEPSLQGFAKLLPQKVKVGGGGGLGMMPQKGNTVP